jgi:hypothetical protein
MSFLNWVKSWFNVADGGQQNTKKNFLLFGGVESNGDATQPTDGFEVFPIRVNKNGELFVQINSALQIQQPLDVRQSIGFPFDVRNTTTTPIFTKNTNRTINRGYVLNTTNIPILPLKIGSGVIRNIVLSNTGTATNRAFLKLYDKITAPTATDVPILELQFFINNGTVFFDAIDLNIPFVNGLHMAICGAGGQAGISTPVGVSNNFFYVIEHD